MFSTIEEAFKKKSNVIKNQIRFIVSTILCVSIEIVIAYFLPQKLSTILIFLVCGDIFFYLVCYIYIINSNWKLLKKSWWKIFDIDYNRSEFSKKLQQKDLVILKEILVENNINTRNEIKELIRHYQCLLPKTIKRSGISTSIFALVASIWALLYKESMDDALLNLFLIITVSIAILILYGLTLYIYNDWFKIFGKTAMYARLEAALTEIYVNYPIAKRKSKSEK